MKAGRDAMRQPDRCLRRAGEVVHVAGTAKSVVCAPASTTGPSANRRLPRRSRCAARRRTRRDAAGTELADLARAGLEVVLDEVGVGDSPRRSVAPPRRRSGRGGRDAARVGARELLRMIVDDAAGDALRRRIERPAFERDPLGPAPACSARTWSRARPLVRQSCRHAPVSDALRGRSREVAPRTRRCRAALLARQQADARRVLRSTACRGRVARRAGSSSRTSPAGRRRARSAA